MEEFIQKVIELLERLDGLEVIQRFCLGDVFRVEMSITSPNARLLIHQIAESTNIELNVYVNHRVSESVSLQNPDSALVYRFTSSKELNSTEQAGWLGTHITWALYKGGLISDEEEQDLCLFFGAISRSA